MIAIPSGLYLGFSAPFMWTAMSPALAVMGVVLLAAQLLPLYGAYFTDPGFVPRVPKPAFDARAESIQRAERDPFAPFAMRPEPPLTVDITTGGAVMRTKYCSTCNVYRTTRMSHCSACEACCEQFDHHCPWVGNCVGARNYRYFYLFVTFCVLDCVYVFATSLAHLIVLGNSLPDDGSTVAPFFRAMGVVPSVPIVIVYVFFVAWAVGGLAAYHTCAVCRNRTTHEDIRRVFKNKRNPFSAGGCRNCRLLVCSRPLPSLIARWREFLAAGVDGDPHAVVVEPAGHMQ